MSRTELQSAFLRDARALGATRDEAAWCTRLITAYDEPHRAYHTMKHIEHGLGELEALRGSLANPSLVNLAYWFHDAVYAQNPPTSNEAESGRMAVEAFRSMGIAEALGERARSLILATKTHELPADVAWNDDPDLETLQDVDLSILAADPYTFACFERDVRKEYDWVPLESAFVLGRTKVLESFIGRPFIYKRPALHARWELRARENLQRTLDVLRGSAGDGVDATDTCIFSTSKGRLTRAHPWRDVAYVSASPLPGGPRIELFVSFGAHGNDGLHVPLGVPWAARAASYLRSIPGYDPSAEANALRTRSPHIAFSAAKSGVIDGTVQQVLATSPYR